jgi:ribonucleoside-diphosphate reductase alpha chain
MMNMTYGDARSVKLIGQVMQFINDAAYLASTELAAEKGSFPALDVDKYLESGFMKTRDEQLRNIIKLKGIRNSHLTSIAPTGTISLFANNVSSGIEPMFAKSYTRKVLNNDGSHDTEVVKDYAVWLWETMFPGRPLSEHFVTAQTLTPADHIRVQAAVQKHIDSSISKTTNCPEDITLEDFKNIYMDAWDSGCKGCTTYRPNEVTGSVLTSADEPVPQEETAGAACTISIDPNTGQMIRTCDA